LYDHRRNKFIGWAALVLAIQNWLGESQDAKKTTSQPAYFSVGMSCKFPLFSSFYVKVKCGWGRVTGVLEGCRLWGMGLGRGNWEWYRIWGNGSWIGGISELIRF
jgi:hypothetical protein